MKLLRYCNLLLSLCLALAMGAAQARYDQVEFFHLIERNDVGGTRKALAEGQFNANTFNHEGFSALYLALREPAPAAGITTLTRMPGCSGVAAPRAASFFSSCS